MRRGSDLLLFVALGLLTCGSLSSCTDEPNTWARGVGASAAQATINGVGASAAQATTNNGFVVLGTATVRFIYTSNRPDVASTNVPETPYDINLLVRPNGDALLTVESAAPFGTWVLTGTYDSNARTATFASGVYESGVYTTTDVTGKVSVVGTVWQDAHLEGEVTCNGPQDADGQSVYDIKMPAQPGS